MSLGPWIALALAGGSVAFGAWRGCGVCAVDEGDTLRIRNPWRTYVLRWAEITALTGRQPGVLKGAVCPAVSTPERSRPLTICGLACFGRVSGATSRRDVRIADQVQQLAEVHEVDASGYLKFIDMRT